ncbi:PREDICTED: myb-like protein X [Cyphomyrmex costatus]|uniref:myb-like protein X n=1 Tax=Cyphomyrmex costatus TaxID=456900 RepID=UPI0008524352|nr:PREDICTED: myb-like protein X [Cyphomyrmex costatus]
MSQSSRLNETYAVKSHDQVNKTKTVNDHTEKIPRGKHKNVKFGNSGKIKYCSYYNYIDSMIFYNSNFKDENLLRVIGLKNNNDKIKNNNDKVKRDTGIRIAEIPFDINRARETYKPRVNPVSPSTSRDMSVNSRKEIRTHLAVIKDRLDASDKRSINAIKRENDKDRKDTEKNKREKFDRMREKRKEYFKMRDNARRQIKQAKERKIKNQIPLNKRQRVIADPNSQQKSRIIFASNKLRDDRRELSIRRTRRSYTSQEKNSFNETKNFKKQTGLDKHLFNYRDDNYRKNLKARAIEKLNKILSVNKKFGKVKSNRFPEQNEKQINMIRGKRDDNNKRVIPVRYNNSRRKTKNTGSQQDWQTVAYDENRASRCQEFRVKNRLRPNQRYSIEQGYHIKGNQAVLMHRETFQDGRNPERVISDKYGV